MNVQPAGVAHFDAPTVFVVEDDDDVRESLEQLLRSVGMQANAFSGGEALIGAFEAEPISGPACIVLDVRLRGASGLMVQRELARRGIAHPVIFITGHGDIVMTVKAMKAGAVNFLTKPVRDQDLLEAIAEAVDLDRTRIAEELATQDIKNRWLELTPRQRQVMHFVACGMPNREIAEELGITEITVKIYRGEGMRRLGTRTLGEFLSKARMLGIAAVTSPNTPGAP
ncbi:response regulator transcription factor [Paraburkholderia acidisoli]|uniref:response regulator transcription factor n=1 Tax=Paraburkholderia acidisoli TaxID=2571748 RepID=UPI0018EEFD66|nr:response regulator [Paraburkholderia acidisoli]